MNYVEAMKSCSTLAEQFAKCMNLDVSAILRVFKVQKHSERGEDIYSLTVSFAQKVPKHRPPSQLRRAAKRKEKFQQHRASELNQPLHQDNPHPPRQSPLLSPIPDDLRKAKRTRFDSPEQGVAKKVSSSETVDNPAMIPTTSTLQNQMSAKKPDPPPKTPSQPNILAPSKPPSSSDPMPPSETKREMSPYESMVCDRTAFTRRAFNSEYSPHMRNPTLCGASFTYSDVASDDHCIVYKPKNKRTRPSSILVSIRDLAKLALVLIPNCAPDTWPPSARRDFLYDVTNICGMQIPPKHPSDPEFYKHFDQ